MPSSVGVVFELRRAATRPGETVCVVGAKAELGRWLPLPQDLEDEARSLRTSPAMYPAWASRAPIWLELGAEPDSEIQLEYKFVRDMRGLTGQSREQAQWEASISNRRVSLPGEDGSCWVVSHGCWDCDLDVPQVARLLPQDVALRQAALGMDAGSLETCYSARSRSTGKPGTPRLDMIHSGRGMPSGMAGISRTIVPKVPLKAMISPVAPELQRSDVHKRDHFQMTPRAQEVNMEEVNNSSSDWPIEAEFSTNFSQPKSSDGEEEDTIEELEFVRQESVAKDGLLMEMKRENERLRSVVSEAAAQVEQLFMENAALRDTLEKHPHTCMEKDEGGFHKKDSMKEFDEPQEEPRANGESPKATHRVIQ